MTDPDIEGPFANGCHCEVNDAISLCIETTAHLHAMMSQVFAQVRRRVNEACGPGGNDADRKQFAADPAGYVKTLLLRMLELRSGLLRDHAWEEHRKSIDDEDRTYQRGQFANAESKTDFNNWLYRRYNLWNLETHIQYEHCHRHSIRPSNPFRP